MRCSPVQSRTTPVMSTGAMRREATGSRCGPPHELVSPKTCQRPWARAHVGPNASGEVAVARRVVVTRPASPVVAFGPVHARGAWGAGGAARRGGASVLFRFANREHPESSTRGAARSARIAMPTACSATRAASSSVRVRTFQRRARPADWPLRPSGGAILRADHLETLGPPGRTRPLAVVLRAAGPPAENDLEERIPWPSRL
jgi:hypothetical protein